MSFIASPLGNAWPWVALLLILAGIGIVALPGGAGLLDGALAAADPGPDGPLLAPFRWAPIASNLG